MAPIRGSDSISLAVATSRSTIAVDASVFLGLLAESPAPSIRAGLRRRSDRLLPFTDRGAFVPARWAESTAASCRASACSLAPPEAPSPRAARTTRTLAPRTMTPARNSSAFRSAGVGMAARSYRRSPIVSSVYLRVGSFYARTRLCLCAAVSRARAPTAIRRTTYRAPGCGRASTAARFEAAWLASSGPTPDGPMSEVKCLAAISRAQRRA